MPDINAGSAVRALPLAVADIAAFQADGQLLTRFIMAHSKRTIAGLPAVGPDAPEPARWEVAQGFAELLYANPAEVAADSSKVDRLIALLDHLAVRAAPATPDTIRLTGTFILPSSRAARKILGRSETDREDALRATASQMSDCAVIAQSLRRFVRIIGALGIASLAFALILLVHAASGRGLLESLAALRTEYAAADREVGAANAVLAATSRERPGAALPTGCSPLPDELRAAVQARLAACGKLEDVSKRFDLLYTALGRWNATSKVFAMATPNGVAEQFARPRLRVSGQDWETTEIRTVSTLKSLTSFVLPMALGLVGACTAFARRINRRIEEWTLESRDRWQGILRVAMGLVAGSLVGALFTKADTVDLQGFTLTLPAIAFFVGYGVTVVFDMLDAIIEPVSEKIRNTFAPAKPAR